MTSYRFQLVKMIGVRKTADGRRQSKTFSQTLNPCNRRADGDVKTRADISLELAAERDAWVRETK